MPLTTLFANLTDPTGPELDEDLSELGAVGVIPCSVSGTNTLTLTPLQPTPDRAAYANYMMWSGIAAATNTGVLTAAIGSLASLVVYKDLGSGPVVCGGSELIIGNAFTLIYDSALASGTGGFHLVSTTAQVGLFLPLTGGVLSGALLGPTITGTVGGFTTFTAATVTISSLLTMPSTATISAFNATLSTITSGSITASLASVGSITGSLGSITNFLMQSATVGTLNVSSLSSVAKLMIGASAASITRILSAVGTLTYTVTPANTSQDQPLLVPGSQLNDSVALGPPASLFVGIGFSGYLAAAGTVNVRLLNANAASVSAVTVTIRATAVGFT